MASTRFNTDTVARSPRVWRQWQSPHAPDDSSDDASGPDTPEPSSATVYSSLSTPDPILAVGQDGWVDWQVPISVVNKFQQRKLILADRELPLFSRCDNVSFDTGDPSLQRNITTGLGLSISQHDAIQVSPCGIELASSYASRKGELSSERSLSSVSSRPPSPLPSASDEEVLVLNDDDNESLFPPLQSDFGHSERLSEDRSYSAEGALLTPDDDLNDVEDACLDKGRLGVTAEQYSREQTQRLRQYSSLYVEFSRDPWKWHNKAPFMQECLPSINQSTYQSLGMDNRIYKASEESTNAASNVDLYSTSTVPDPGQYSLAQKVSRAQMVSPSTPRHSRMSNLDDEQVNVPKLTRPGSPRSQRKTKRKDRVFGPLALADYCDKCCRHFSSTWQMEAHLATSRAHPYYCKTCTMDWPTFGALHRHYAEKPSCRPPEFEFGAGKPFVQLLAEYQETGKLPNRHPAILTKSSHVGQAEQGSRPEESAAASKQIPPERQLSDAGLQFFEASQEVISSSSVIQGLRRARPVEVGRVYEPPACPICIKPLKTAGETLATACGHVYCARCILYYFRREKSECPKCRTPVSLATVVPLQLY